MIFTIINSSFLTDPTMAFDKIVLIIQYLPSNKLKLAHIIMKLEIMS